MKRLAFGFLLLAITALSACNTVEGAGKDVESAGEEVQEAAKGESSPSRLDPSDRPGIARPVLFVRCIIAAVREAA